MQRRGRKINKGQRNISGMYFDLACEIVNLTQEEVARIAGVPASTLSRAFSGRLRIKREKLLAWSDILFRFCPEEDKELLRDLENEMLHTLGHSTRSEEQRGIEQLSYYQEQVRAVLEKRQQQKP